MSSLWLIQIISINVERWKRNTLICGSNIARLTLIFQQQHSCLEIDLNCCRIRLTMFEKYRLFFICCLLLAGTTGLLLSYAPSFKHLELQYVLFGISEALLLIFKTVYYITPNILFLSYCTNFLYYFVLLMSAFSKKKVWRRREKICLKLPNFGKDADLRC